MNRSFNSDDVNDYEKSITKNLLNRIKGDGYDYVLDLHTTTTRVGCCMLISELNKTTERIISAAIGIDTVIKLPADIAHHSLIGVVKGAVSIECYEPLAGSEKVLFKLVEMVERLLVGMQLEQRTVDMFEVDEYITESQSEYTQRDNFEEHKGKYPILVGGKLGRTYSGFLASKKVQIKL
jgi:hypothetical protein